MGRIFQLRKPATSHPHVRTRAWEVSDPEELAHAIADLAMGQWAHVETVLKLSGEWPIAAVNYSAEGAIRDLTVEPGKDPWHRDGWVFQMISWIVAVESGLGPTRPPQMDQASKGFDGLQLVVSGTSVDRVLIFEDKATEDPRGTVRDDVWPSFEALERKDRDHALTGELAYLIGRVAGVDPIEAVNRIMRDVEGRSYRVSITTGGYHAQHEQFNGLFKGFEDVVTGPRLRRYGNVFEVDDLRNWMNDLCGRSVAILQARL